MSRHLPQSHKPHGRLDNGFAISQLRKAKPLFNFGDFDRQEQLQRQRRPPPWEAAALVLDSVKDDGRRRVAATDWVLQGGAQQVPPLPACTADPLVYSTDLLAPGFNNSAATPRELQGSHPNKGKLMEHHLRLAYGDQLFRRGKYVAPVQLGPVLPTPKNFRSSVFKSLRSQIVDSVLPEIFSDSLSPSDAAKVVKNVSPQPVFEWCDSNRNNSAGGVGDITQRVSYRTAKMIKVRRELSNWIYIYFRVRRVSWEFMIHEERANSQSINLYGEGVLDKWTVKLRFRMLKEAPMKFPMLAFLCRMGLEDKTDIVFTTDGFYGDLLVGGLHKRNTVPHRQVSFNTTAQALGLQNGDNVFVVRASSTLRANVETQKEVAARRRHAGGVVSDNDIDNDPENDEEEDDESEDNYDSRISDTQSESESSVIDLDIH